MGCAGLGSGLLYMQWGRSKLKTIGVGEFLSRFDLSDKKQLLFEMVILVITGAVVAMIFTRPVTPAQAFSAGLGWTGFAARPGGTHSKRNASKGGQ